MPDTTDFLLYYQGLARSTSKKRGIDLSQLEKEFLRFSQYRPEKKLDVELPKLYPLEGEKKQHYLEALTSCGVSLQEVPTQIDIGGNYEKDFLAGEELHQKNDNWEELLIFLSIQQFKTAHVYNYRSFLNPLLEKVYTEGAPLLRDFALHEAVIGRLRTFRGELNLEEAHLFPERFLPGAYRIDVHLDTPSHSIKNFEEIQQLLKKFKDNPRENLLNPQKVNLVTRKALDLRARIGSLSRYTPPDTTKLSTEANSVVLRNGDVYYLYSPTQNRNVLVYFGASLFNEEQTPRHLTILKGAEHQVTLAKLVEMEFYKPSEAILENRLSDLNRLYEQAARGENKALSEDLNFQSLRKKLKEAANYFGRVRNKNMRKEYIVGNQEILEFVVCPNSEEPLLQELLPRLSWNTSVRHYHNPFHFIPAFEKADESGKRELLGEVVSNLIFSHLQNNDVNVWLYKNHQQLCEQNGVQFRVVGK